MSTSINYDQVSGSIDTNLLSLETYLQNRHSVNVKDFGATGDGVTDDTAAILAAIAAADTTDYEEVLIVFPAGAYSVTQIDLTGLTRLTFFAVGTVQILGRDTTSTYEYILGFDGYDGGAPYPIATQMKFTGGRWLVQGSGVTTYTIGIKLHAVTTSVFNNLNISGQFTDAAMDIQFSYVNSFNDCTASNLKTGHGSRIYVIKMGNNNCNLNVWRNMRLAGTNNPADDIVGWRVNGNSNAVYSCDISAVTEGMQVDGSRGTTIIGLYMEAVKYGVTSGRAVVGNTIAHGVTIHGGFIEILTDGIGIWNDTSVSAYGWFSMSVQGFWFKGVTGGSNRTAVDLGTQAYNTTIDGISYTDIDTKLTGTIKSGGGIGERLIGPIKVLPDGGMIPNGIKSGASQVASGAAAGELWVDTADQTVKVGV